MTATFKVAIITVSDTAYQDANTDRTGPQLQELLEQQNRAEYELLASSIASDDASTIRQALTEAIARGANLVLTAGGTGFGPRDVTPEAVSPLITKPAPGLVQLMMQSSLKITPLAALARPVAGLTSQDALVITLPGSPKGAKENLEALLPILNHALQLSTAHSSSRELHQQGEQPGTLPSTLPAQATSASTAQHTHDHHHHHHHHHHQHQHEGPRPKTHNPEHGSAARHRKSPFPIISMSEALEIIFEQSPPAFAVRKPVTTALRGYVLAEDVAATYEIPGRPTTNVDGYAVHSDDGEGVFEVLTSKSHPLPFTLPRGSVYRVNTGGPLPQGADAVVMVEDTEVAEQIDETAASATGVDAPSKGEEKSVRILAASRAGEHVRQPGSDLKSGDIVLPKGTLITETGGELASICFVGASSVRAYHTYVPYLLNVSLKLAGSANQVKVYEKPKVAVMSTGNEIVDIEMASAGFQLQPTYDTNRPALTQMLESAGYEVIDLGIIKDDETATANALLKGAEQADVILATGGTSMGEFDYLKPVIERRMNGKIHFGRVSMKPGKPTTFATFQPLWRPKVIFSLPGNPASALVTCSLFVLPALRKMGGLAREAWELPRVKVAIDQTMRLDPSRPEFHRVAILPLAQPPYLLAKSTGGQRSSAASSMALANGLVCLPAGPAENSPRKGDIVDAVMLTNLH